MMNVLINQCAFWDVLFNPSVLDIHTHLMDDLFYSEMPILHKTLTLRGTTINYDCFDSENCQIAKYVPLVNWNSDDALVIKLDEYLQGQTMSTDSLRVAELGSGLGIPSIYFAKNYSFKELMINDGDETSITFIKQNLVQNEPYKTKKIEVSNFWWFTQKEIDSSDFQMGHLKSGYDIIIGSDVIYDKSTVRSLLTTIMYLLSPNGLCVLTNFYSRFYKNEAEFNLVVSALNLSSEITKTGDKEETILCWLRHKLIK